MRPKACKNFDFPVLLLPLPTVKRLIQSDLGWEQGYGKTTGKERRETESEVGGSRKQGAGRGGSDREKIATT
jgi:hypothetical protein